MRNGWLTWLGIWGTVSVPFSVCVSEIGISLEADCGDERWESSQLDKLKETWEYREGKKQDTQKNGKRVKQVGERGRNKGGKQG